MKVRFTFSKVDKSTLTVDYIPFDYAHSKLWVNGIRDFLNSNQTLTDVNRVYNFTDYNIEFKTTLDLCNDIINTLNRSYVLNMPHIRAEQLQSDINFVHTFFVESNRREYNLTDPRWSELNALLHGLEIIERNRFKPLQGQVFCSLPNSASYDLLEESYKYFTTKKRFGYCYANYPHVGRHIFEMFNAKDEEASDEDILPMSKIAGDSYLWFGRNTSALYDLKRRWDIKRWFCKNKIEKILGMKWGNPHLAIGWLPVAQISTNISKESLIGLHQLEKIEIID